MVGRQVTEVTTPPPDEEQRESEREILGIARGGALNIGGQLCSQISFFLITLILARTLGRADIIASRSARKTASWTS